MIFLIVIKLKEKNQTKVKRANKIKITTTKHKFTNQWDAPIPIAAQRSNCSTKLQQGYIKDLFHNLDPFNESIQIHMTFKIQQLNFHPKVIASLSILNSKLMRYWFFITWGLFVITIFFIFSLKLITPWLLVTVSFYLLSNAASLHCNWRISCCISSNLSAWTPL